MDTTEKMITRTEAADRLGVSMRTLDRYIRQGRFTSHKYTRVTPTSGGTVRIPESALAAYIAAAEVATERDGGENSGPETDH